MSKLSVVDEIDCGSFFDQMDDILEFPSEDVVDDALEELPKENCDAFPSIWPPQSNSFLDTNSVFSGNSSSDLAVDISVPHEDIVQLEWLSMFVEDSFSGESLTMTDKIPSSVTKDSSLNQFQISSPVSVLESSSSCSGEKTVQLSSEAVIPVQRARTRSKRPRPATFNTRMPVQLISPTSSEAPGSKVPSDSENFAESPLFKIPNQANVEPKKKKKIKMSNLDGTVETNHSQTVRKCMHCEITKTPQWRAGPMGPKTLCNACGVRYKSGRLFPEYRPAASPTFVPLLHSNSHRKVVEMRNKANENPSMPETAEATMTNSAEM